MKKIIFGVLLIVLIAVGIFIFSIARSFNVDFYKKQVIANLEQLTGRHVTCSEEASLSWRPKPTLIMNDLVISNQDGSSTPNMISVKQIQVEIDWSSFLRPSLVVKKVILKNPTVLVERLHSYQTNFTFPYLFNPSQVLDKEGIIGGSTALKINEFEVIDGSVTYHNDLTSDMFVLIKVNGHGRVDSLNGPFSFNGKANVLEQAVDINLTVNKLVVSQPVMGTLVLKNKVGNTQVNMSYSLSTNKNDDWLVLDGNYSSQSPMEFFNQFNDIKWPDLGELSGYFKMVVNPKESLLKEFVLVQGNEQKSVSCNVMLTVDEQTQKDKWMLSMDYLDYALWRPLLNKLIPLFLKGKNGVLLDASVQKLSWNDQISSDIKIQGELKDDVLNGNASANLPWEGVVNISGQWNIPQNAIKGEANLQTQDLSSFIQWLLGQDPTWLPSIKKGLSQWVMKIDLSNDRQLIDIQSGNLGKTKMLGSIELMNDAFKTDLKLQNLDLDAYYPNLNKNEESRVHVWLEDIGKYFVSLKKTGKISLDISDVGVFQNVFNKIVFKGQWIDQNWDVEQFDVQKENEIDVKFSGKIQQLGTPDFNLQNAHWVFNIPNWSFWKDYFDWLNINTKLKQFSEVSGSVHYSGSLKEGEIEAETLLDKLKVNASGHVFPSVQGADKIHVVLSYPDFIQLMKMQWPEKEWSAEWAVPMDFDGVISKDSKKVTWTDISVSLGKNRLKTSGQWQPNSLDLYVLADQLVLDSFLPSFDNMNNTIEIPSNMPNVRLDVVADRFVYSGIKGSQLKLKASSEQSKWTITGLDFLVGEEQPGRFSLDGTVELNKTIQPNIHFEWDKIQVGKKDLSFGSYRLTEGALSGSAQIKSNGNSLAALIGNASGQGRMSWISGMLYGVDASAWLTAVQSALAAEQMGEGFSSRLQYALANGKTKLPDLEGTFSVNKGMLNFMDLHGANDLVTLSSVVVDWDLVKKIVHIKMPVILTAISKLPPILFDFNYNSYSIQNIPFERAFDEELHLKNRQSAEARQLQNLKATEVKNQQMRSEAQNIMNNMEHTLKQLQEKVALRSDEEANRKMDELNYTAREIRDLAVKVDLTPNEYAALLEKTRLWAVQVTDLNNFYARQDLLNQKVKTNQLSPMVSDYLVNLEQIYQQHPQSVILAEIVMNARQVATLIKEDEIKLAQAQDAKTVQDLILKIQDNFDKIEKAHQYAQKLHLSMMNGGVNL